jgi:Domain of unknown function (DUF4148)
MSHTQTTRLTEADKTANQTRPARNPPTCLKDIIMNTKTLIAAAALALMGSTAFADEVRDYPTPSTLTRAEVRAELDRAQANGELTIHSDTYGFVAPAGRIGSRPVVASLSRVEVRRDLASAPNAATITGESYGTVVPGDSIRSREAVRAEAMMAMKQQRHPSLYTGS